jgi:hypothetical protein
MIDHQARQQEPPHIAAHLMDAAPSQESVTALATW